jgi:copper chaperone
MVWSFGMASGTRTYLVEGISCHHCKVAITEEVTEVAGVESVDVDLDTKLVRIAGDEPDDAALVAAIDEAGYDAQPAQTGAADA